MPEIIEDDRIASLFNEFRAEAGGEILPPGIRAAEQTVRRRRMVRLVGTAALGIVGLVGATVGIANLSGGTGTPVDPAGTQSFGPTLDPDARARLGVEALAMLGYKPTADNSRPELLPVRPGILFGEVGTETSAFSYGFGTADEPFPQGEYTLSAVCLGRGAVSVGWRVPGGPPGHVEFGCGTGDDGRSRVVSFSVPVPGVLTLTVTPDQEASGRAGIAVVVTDPRVVLARNALTEAAPGLMSGAEALLNSNLTNVDETGSEIGTYQLTIACAGVGTVDVTFKIGESTISQAPTCTKAGEVTGMTLVSPTAGATISVVFEPDSAARGQAAVAYRITKL